MNAVSNATLCFFTLANLSTQSQPVIPKYIAHLLNEVLTTIGYIVKRQWNLKWVPNQRAAACFTMEKRHLLLHILV